MKIVCFVKTEVTPTTPAFPVQISAQCLLCLLKWKVWKCQPTIYCIYLSKVSQNSDVLQQQTVQCLSGAKLYVFMCTVLETPVNAALGPDMLV